MKKLSLLFTFLALLFAVVGARADGYQLGSSSLTIDDATTKNQVALMFQKDASSEAKLIYYDTDSSKFFLGDASTVLANSKAQYRFKIAKDMKYKDADAYSIQFVDDNKYFTIEWNGENKADSKDNRPFVITANAGVTNGYEFRCYRTNDPVKENEVVKIDESGDTVFSDRAITFADNGGTDAWWVAGIITIFEVTDGGTEPTPTPDEPSDEDKTSFDWSKANKEWNADNLTVDADSKTITFNSTDAGNAAVSWLGGTATDISGYEKLVLELAEASDGDIEVVVSDGGFWGKYSSSSLAKGGTELSINLKDLKITSTPGENDTWKTGDALDLTQVNMIYLRTAWTTSQTIKVKDFYLAKSSGSDEPTPTPTPEPSTDVKADATGYLGSQLTLEQALTKDNVALVFRKDATSAGKVIYYDEANEFVETDNDKTKTHFALGDATVMQGKTSQYKFKIAGDMTYDNATAYSVQFVADSKYLTVEWNGEQKKDSKDNRPFVIAANDTTTNGYTFRCYRTDDINTETQVANDRAITFNNNGGTDAWWTPGIVYLYEIVDNEPSNPVDLSQADSYKKPEPTPEPEPTPAAETDEVLGTSLTLDEALQKDAVTLVFRKDATSANQVIYYDVDKEFTLSDGSKTHFALGNASEVTNNANAQYRFKISGDMTYNSETAYSIQFTNGDKYLTVEWNGEQKSASKDNRPFVITHKDGTANGYEFRCYRTDDINQETGAVSDRAITFNGNGGTDAWWTAGIIYMYEAPSGEDATEPEPDAVGYLGSKTLNIAEAAGKDVALVFRKDANSAGKVIYFDMKNAHETASAKPATRAGEATTHFTLGDTNIMQGDYAQYKFKIADDMTYDGQTAYSIQFVSDGKYLTVEWNGEQKSDSKDNRPFVITPVENTDNGYKFVCYRTDDINSETGNANDRAITFNGNGGTDAWYTPAIIYIYEVTTSDNNVDISQPDPVAAGISSVKADKADAEAVYNLKGMRVSKPEKGVYIKGGKKYTAK